ncbi:MAG TPA: hypothetical protein VFN57_03950 [Thermomicrobiaceae bacterium]|nr:hypothetical protein [Thermomicrobiaceae bacterium]
MPEQDGYADDALQARDQQTALTPVAEVLRAAGFYAYVTLDAESRWSVACDTDEGHVDVRIGADGLDLDVWDTSPGLFAEEEDERHRAAQERLARVSLTAVSRGVLEPGQEAWWDEPEQGIGVRLRYHLPFTLQPDIGTIAKRCLAELNEVIALVEQRLTE